MLVAEMLLHRSKERSRGQHVREEDVKDGPAERRGASADKERRREVPNGTSPTTSLRGVTSFPTQRRVGGYEICRDV